MNQAMLMKLQKMQKEMMQTQKDIEESVFKGTAGGVVTVEVKGNKDVLSVKIDPEAVEGPEDVEMLEDTIVAAINDAFKTVDKTTEEKMAKYQSMFGGMPGLF